MSAQPMAVISTGLVSSVGLSAPAACAAIRVGLTNPVATHFLGAAGEWLMSHTVPLDESIRGVTKLAHMAAMVSEECLQGVAKETWEQIPQVLCVAERTRPGRLDGLEDELPAEICALLDDARFAADSCVIPHGRVSAAVASLQARKLL